MESCSIKSSLQEQFNITKLNHVQTIKKHRIQTSWHYASKPYQEASCKKPTVETCYKDIITMILIPAATTSCQQIPTKP